MADHGGGDGRRGLVAAGTRFLLRRPRVLVALAGWSVLEAAHTFALGFALARALDDGFLRGRPAVGLWWLAAAVCGLLAGALGTSRVYRSVAALTEPLRDALVRRVVGRGLYEAVAGGNTPSGAARAGSSSVVSRLTHQVEIARDSFAGLVMVSRSFVFTAVGALAGLFLLAPALLVVVLPPLAAGLAVFALTLRPLARRQRMFLEADEELAGEVGRTFAALRDVTACGAEERVRRTGLLRIETERRAADALARWSVFRALALGLGGRLPVVLLLVMAPWLLARGVTAGALAGALTYLTQALLPALQSLVHGLGGAGARLAVVIGRLREEPQPGAALPRAQATPGTPPPTHAPEPEPVHPALELRGVTFAYGPGAEPVLRGLDLVLPSDGHLTVVGPSGAGKSTLALLVAGLLAPTAGTVRVGGEPPTSVERRVLIPQEAYVFSGSVRDNLGCLLPAGGSATDQRMLAALEAVGAGELVRRLGGLRAIVEPRALSSGERQLLALARAYLTPAPLVLLDEAGSQLDPAAEERAEHAFARRPGALVVVAHRISSALRADSVLVLDGVRTRCGTHAELLEHSPLYRDLTAHWVPGPRR
ncbi:ATP-binding cassette domain-containing protein [Streptomyces iconiensis]|uniref:ABC transporter ATP-binding protein n=1 Tax=Streptomyces iconiensis TaxID=1384038 RepID=A0ABT6ZVA7_9ACTN|nr:ABC transporter ATP-binding protein [Streptomyces iconiensis]MDJ1133009.1 ABC transporter ATP-binding protein [Streptomyces iconiensis]